METVNGGGGGGGGGLPQQLPAAAVQVFKEGITLILSRWSALEMAVVNEWGGRDSRTKSEQLAGDIFTWFTQSKEPLYIDDLEELLDGAMLESFKTMTEDGSVDEVAEKLMIMHEECLEGNYRSVESLREVPRARAVPHIRQANDDDDDDDDEDEEDDDEESMVVDAPNLMSNLKPVDMSIDEPRPSKPIAKAEDGWTTVSSKKNRGKRS